jgi:hypothetical protein
MTAEQPEPTESSLTSWLVLVVMALVVIAGLAVLAIRGGS